MAAAGLRFDPTKENPDRCVCDHCALDLYDFEAGAPEQSLALHAYGVMRPGIRWPHAARHYKALVEAVKKSTGTSLHVR